MRRFNKTIVVSAILLLYITVVPDSNAWENQKTHPAITKEAVDRSSLNGFLKNQIGFNDGLETQLELTFPFQDVINIRVSQEPEFKWDNKTKVSILEWLMK